MGATPVAVSRVSRLYIDCRSNPLRHRFKPLHREWVVRLHWGVVRTIYKRLYKSSPIRIEIFIPGRGRKAGDPDPSHVSVTIL